MSNSSGFYFKALIFSKKFMKKDLVHIIVTKDVFLKTDMHEIIGTRQICSPLKMIEGRYVVRKNLLIIISP